MIQEDNAIPGEDAKEDSATPSTLEQNEESSTLEGGRRTRGKRVSYKKFF